jgi:hypothetical protein
MAALLASRLRFACLFLLLAAPALAQRPADKPESVRPPAATTSSDASSRLAEALRASTRVDPANYVPSVSLLKEFLNAPHTGPTADAVVGVEVTNRAKSGAVETRHCSGLLIRCDGFFLLPPSITTLSMGGGEEAVKQTIRVTINPGAPRETQANAYIRHYIVDGVDMTVMKVQGIHAPAARTLRPDTRDLFRRDVVLSDLGRAFALYAPRDGAGLGHGSACACWPWAEIGKSLTQPPTSISFPTAFAAPGKR